MPANGGESPHLVRRCLHGDEGAWRELFERYGGLCQAIARSALSGEGRSYVLDAAQEAWIDVLLHLREWQGKSETSLRAWIAAVAHRRAIHLRKRLRPQHAVEEHASSPIPDHGAPGGRNQRSSEFLDALVAMSRHLPPRAQLVLRRLLEGKAQCEIAAALGVSERTVRRDVEEIRRRAKEFLEPVSGSA